MSFFNCKEDMIGWGVKISDTESFDKFCVYCDGLGITSPSAHNESAKQYVDDPWNWGQWKFLFVDGESLNMTDDSTKYCPSGVYTLSMETEEDSNWEGVTLNEMNTDQLKALICYVMDDGVVSYESGMKSSLCKGDFVASIRKTMDGLSPIYKHKQPSERELKLAELKKQAADLQKSIEELEKLND